MMEQHTIGIGISDYLKLRAYRHNYFVDKSLFIQRVLTDQSEVQLFPRPRRFGKTLNLTMLKAFVERDVRGSNDHWPHEWAFDGLQVMQDRNVVADHAGKYPVVYLTFKDVKASDWRQALLGISEVIATEVERLLPFFESAGIPAYHHEYLQTLLKRRADESDMVFFLKRITALLAQSCNHNAIILIDEYDTPILSAWTHGYYDAAITFLRTFLGAGLKDNPYLAKGVLTGILRIAKESVFSDLNNLMVYSLLHQAHATSFGFTSDEVGTMLSDFHRQNDRHQVTRWYDGYIFGGQTIYNPWSILNFLKAPKEGCRPYWLNTSSNDLVRELVMGRADTDNERLQQELHQVITGQPLEKVLDDHIVLRRIHAADDSLWHLLVMTGYLKATFAGLTSDERRAVYHLTIPNLEVSLFYDDALQVWLNRVSGVAGAMPDLLTALIQGHTDVFARLLQDIVLGVLSYYDVGGREPERVYHALLLGALLHLRGVYEIRSNREAGLGRCDIALIPRTTGQRGVIIELKKAAETDKLETKAQKALEQAQARDYVTILRQRGADPLVLVGIALRGKNVAVCWEETAAGDYTQQPGEK